MSNLGPRWTGSYHTKEGFQVSKREWQKSKENLQREKARGIAPWLILSTCIHVYNSCRI